MVRLSFWSAFNLEVNREYFKVNRVRIFEQMEDMVKHPVTKYPIKIAETEGEQVIEVYQGDFRHLPSVIPPIVNRSLLLTYSIKGTRWECKT